MKFSEMPYERVSYEEVEAKYKGLMEAFHEAKSGEEQFEVHKKQYEISDWISTNITIAQIHHDIDTRDAFFDKEQAYYDEIMPKISNLSVEYAKLLYHSPYKDFLEEKIGKVAFKNIEISLKAFDETLIPLMQEENALTTEYDNLLAGAQIPWNGEVLNLSLMRKYLTSNDRDTRKCAYEAYTSFFAEHAQKLDELFDKLVWNRTKQARELGYDNYLELGYYRMNRNCYDKEMIRKYRDQVKKDFVPFVEALHEKRRKRLGLSKLFYFDEGIYFRNGNPTPVGTPEEILANGQKMYQELSLETKEFFDFMIENELFDVLGRKTKKTGGYMTFLPMYHAPFIFANFNGTSGDVDVITHECGHAFQGYISGKDPIREHAEITMETAEVHSMSMEFFVEPWMKLFFEDRTQDYISMHLEDAAAFIPYGTMVDEFQHIIYENPNMTPMERHTAWRSLEKEYKPHLDYEGNVFFEKGGFWQKQHHIYDYPLYYIDYCLAQTCAFQYKVKMDEDYKRAWESYLKLCKLSASDFYVNMIKEVGLDSPFEDGCMKHIVEKLSEKIKE
ncbi:MAG: M3 family oligoendopeptidase [Velocimicrobium sp.]